ncbi:MAG TPA: NFACT family protein [Stenomitos sp.]
MQIQDSLTVAAVVAELGHRLPGARIEKIHLPTAHEMVWNLRGEGRSERLYFSIRGNFSRLHLTARRFENPAQPPMFCMLLRKHMEGSRILRVEQLELERVVQIVTSGRDELGDPTERALIAEITGKHANLILLDKPWGTIMGSLRTVTAEISRERLIMPGLPYDPPPIPRGKRDPRALQAEDLYEILGAGGTAEQALLKGVHSLSRAAIAQLLHAADLDPKVAADSLEAEQVTRLLGVWEHAFGWAARGRFCPELKRGPGWDYQVMCFGDAPDAPAAVSPMLDTYYGEHELADRMGSQRASLMGLVRERLDKLTSRIESLEEAVQVGKEAETLRQWGELIQAYGYGLPAHADHLVAENYFEADLPKVSIPLDPQRSPMENAQRYFRKYQKAKTSLETSDRFLKEAREELGYWQGVATAIQLSETPAELAEIRSEVQPAPTGKAPSKKEPTVSEPLRYRSSDGFEILVGKNNRQNDLVTMKLARPEDWWFHTQNIPGSHVVVKAAGELPDKTREEAAMLAAYYSQARESSKVPVIYTQRRHLKKPSGAKPGFVIYEREKTLFVTPDLAAISELPRTERSLT